MSKRTKVPAYYENNPFFIATKGFALLFDLALGVAILLIVASLLGAFSGNWRTGEPDRGEWDGFWRDLSQWPVETWLLAIGGLVVVTLAVMLLSALFSGASSYTAVQLSKNKAVSIGEAFREAFDNLWSYLWLQIIIFVKIALWTLLFIVPGIIAATKYSLAGLAFFDESKNLRGNAAIKESIRLTRGAWITTYGAHTLFNFITLGAASSLVTVAVNAVLYRQYDKIGVKKPAAHLLSWVALVVPFVFLALFIMLILFIATIIVMSGEQTF